MRKVIHLNDEWSYKADFMEEYTKPEYEPFGFEEVRLPHANIELPYNNFDEQLYQFVSCYRRWVFIDESQARKNARLHFEGVMAYAKVYVNGRYIGEHKGGYTPFSLDITASIEYGKNNLVVVEVDSNEREDIPPFGHVVDYLTYGGIYREVKLEFVNELHIENMYIRTRDVLTEQPELDMDVYVQNPLGNNEGIHIEFTLFYEGKVHTCFEHRLEGDIPPIANIVQQVKGIQLWDIAIPSLYTLSLQMKRSGELLDEYSSTFGFREAEFRNDGFFLNGRKIKLMGLNRHQSYPYVGYAMPKGAQYRDAEILKYELGVNMVRLSHYPQSRHFLDRCDQLGLLVLEEIPGWQHIGDKQWQQLAIEHVREMIHRDWNRPSIILWGVRINESQDCDEFYLETNRVAKQLDDVRQTGGIRNFEGSRLFEDVYTFNDFLHRGNNRALQKPINVTKKKVPYLVTEHNGHMFPTKRFDHEAKRVEHGLRHLRVLDEMYRRPEISGALGWCMFDYNTHKDFGSGDKICYHGVMDMFRIPKEAAAVYASQQEDMPVMEVSESMNMGDREAAELLEANVFTNCDFIKLYKNGECLGVYYPEHSEYKGVPHPPIIIRDFIGNLIEKHESFSKRDAKAIKTVLYGVVKYGDKALPLKYKLRMGWLMLKNRMSYEKAVSLYTTYVSNWGSKSLAYVFEGYQDNKPVIRVTKGPAASKDLLVIADKKTLVEEETYDVCRIVLKHVDENGNLLAFSNEAVVLQVEGAGELIGPKQIALIGGVRGFWVKTIGKAGTMKVRVHSERFEDKELVLAVNKL